MGGEATSSTWPRTSAMPAAPREGAAVAAGNGELVQEMRLGWGEEFRTLKRTNGS